jgi:tetratricopeptide (TPR) repeat protein
MKWLRNPGLYLFFVLAAAVAYASPADLGIVSGIVRDSQGQPLRGVRVTLSNAQIPSTSKQAVSSSTGEFRFEGLADGEYKITGNLDGYATAGPRIVRIASTPAPVVVDLILSRMSTPEANGTGMGGRPALEFQASGIRGIIDPGGYSASTGAAASGLLRGIADVRRTDHSFTATAAKDWPCGMEPELRKALGDHAEQAAANLRLGQFYVAHDRPAEAIPLLTRALQIDSADAVALRDLALAWLQGGEFEKARRQLSALVEHSDSPEVRQLLARADEGSGAFQEAAEQYRVADREQPTEESVFGVGYELLLAGSLSEGLAVFQAGLDRYPRSLSLHIAVGTAEFLLSKNIDAVRSFLSATDIDPADPRPYSFLASVSSSLADDEMVRKSFKRYLDLVPESGPANYYFAVALSRENETANAARIEILLRRAIHLDPNLAGAHLQLADLYADRHDDQDAVPEYEAAVRLHEDTGEAHYRLAMAYKRIGRTDLSAREMEIFKLSKRQGSLGGDGVDLTQFISVMDAPEQKSSQEMQCPTIHR